MEQMTKQEAMNQLVDAYKTLEVAKEDCKTVTDATVQAYVEGDLTATKADIKAMVAMAKKIAVQKHGEAKEDAAAMVALVKEIGL